MTVEEQFSPPPTGESPPPDIPEEFIKNSPDQPLVAIYNTHNSESYEPSQSKAKLPGQNGEVNRVAQVLAETLEQQYGIPVVRSTAIHDYPDFSLSYLNSEKTLKKLLEQ